MFNRKSQTATEYLIILAVVIVIALVVVNTMGGFPGIGAGSSKKVSDVKLATDVVGIDSYNIGVSSSMFKLKNNYYDTVTVTEFRINQQSNLTCNSSNTVPALPIVLNIGQSVLVNCTVVNSSTYIISEKQTPVVGISYIDQIGATRTAGNVVSYIISNFSNGGILQGGAQSNSTWNKTAGGTLGDGGYGVTTDSLGNVYVIGYTASFGIGNYDYWILKYDTNGNQVWNKTIGGIDMDWGYGIAVDSLGNIFVTGGTLSFGAGNWDFWTLKFDSNGNQVWNKTYGGANIDIGSGITTDSFGNVYVVGATKSFGVGNYDYLTIKYDTNGTQIWNRTLGGTSADTGSAIALDSSGNIFITGYVNSFGAGGNDIWVIKYNNSGTLLWNRTAGGTNADTAKGIVTDSLGNVYVGGSSNSFGAGNYDYWVLKYDTNGTQIWNKTFGGIGYDPSSAITIDLAGNFFITGTTQSFGAGGYDYWTVKFDSSGTQIWNTTFGGTESDFSNGISNDIFGNVYVVGSSNSTGAGGNDIWLVKY